MGAVRGIIREEGIREEGIRGIIREEGIRDRIRVNLLRLQGSNSSRVNRVNSTIKVHRLRI